MYNLIQKIKPFSLIYCLIFFIFIPSVLFYNMELILHVFLFMISYHFFIVLGLILIDTPKTVKIENGLKVIEISNTILNKNRLKVLDDIKFWKKVLDEYLSVGNINLHQGSKTFNTIWSVSCEPEDNDIKLILMYRNELRRLGNLYLDKIDAKRERWLVLPSETVIFCIHPNRSLAINVRDNNIEFIRWNIERLTNNTALTH